MTIQPTTIIRNYLLTATTVILLSLGISELVNAPSRIGQQQRLDGYSYYVGAGLVSYAQSSLR